MIELRSRSLDMVEAAGKTQGAVDQWVPRSSRRWWADRRAPLRTPMKYRRPAADDGTLNLALLVAALAVLVVLRWLALKGGYAV